MNDPSPRSLVGRLVDEAISSLGERDRDESNESGTDDIAKERPPSRITKTFEVTWTVTVRYSGTIRTECKTLDEALDAVRDHFKTPGSSSRIEIYRNETEVHE